eukprot:765948-Hanusia_phi.AAC.4
MSRRGMRVMRGMRGMKKTRDEGDDWGDEGDEGDETEAGAMVAGGQETRLDRLILLLDTGTSSSTRRAAASQIGDLSHSENYLTILWRIKALLKSKKWETRIAAGYAIEAICRKVPVWDPQCAEEGATLMSTSTKDESLAKFDVEGVIARGRILVSSTGTEYDEDSMDPKERLALQKQQLRVTLGLEPAAGEPATGLSAISRKKDDLFNLSDMVAEDDLMSKAPDESDKRMGPDKRKASELIDDLQGSSKPGSEVNEDLLSPRERNQLRRKQRKLMREKTQTNNGSTASAEGKSVVTEQPQDSNKVVVETTVSEVVAADPNEWPLGPICDELCCDIFDPAWEVRHGAAVGLQEILKHHAKGSGKWANTTKEQASIRSTMLWLISWDMRKDL